MPEDSRITELILMHLRGELSGREQQELNDWKERSVENRLFFDQYTQDKALQQELHLFSQFSESNDQAIRKMIAGQIGHSHSGIKKTTIKSKFYAIAAVLCGLLAGSYLIFHQHRSTISENKQSAVLISDIKPGTFRAILKLGNGQSIVLDSAQEGLITSQGSTEIRKLTSGQLIYTVAKGKSETVTSLNTLSTPKAGIFRIKLSDGTIVWLNNASSLTYPTAFTGDTRKVNLQGEAYFEVAHNSNKPFTVTAGKMKIMDVGTAFNVMAYGDEASTDASLVEGEVKINTEGFEAVSLRPGQQARLANADSSRDGAIKVIRHIDIEKAIAWKNGFFHFDRSDIQDVMRQLSRWYDVDVEFRGKTSSHHFDGRIQRSLDLSTLLEALDNSDVHFSIKERTIIVSSKSGSQ
jgi:transmembrane sensor